MALQLALEPKHIFGQIPTATISPTGALATLVVGIPQPPGTVTTAVSGGITPTGEVAGEASGPNIQTIEAAVSGVITWGAEVASLVGTVPSNTATEDVSGVLTPASVVASEVSGPSIATILKSLAGGLGLTGATARQIDPFTVTILRSFGSGIAPGGAASSSVSGPSIETILKSIAGTITPGAVLATQADPGTAVTHTQGVDGTITPAAALATLVSGPSLVTVLQSIAGTITPGATVTIVVPPALVTVPKSLAASLGIGGAVSSSVSGPSLVTKFKSVAGMITPHGAKTDLVIDPPVTFFSKQLFAGLSLSGSFNGLPGGPSNVTVAKSLTSGLSLSSILSRQVGGPSIQTIVKSVSGHLSWAAVVSNSVSGATKITKTVTGGLGLSGTVARLVGGGPPQTDNPIYAGMAGVDQSELDDVPVFPSLSFTACPTSTANIASFLAALKTRNMRCGLGFVSANMIGVQRPDGTFDFSMSEFQTRVDNIAAVPNINTYISDKTFAYLLCGDELHHSKWNGTIPPDTRKQMVAYVKQKMPTMKTALRMTFENLTGSKTPTGGWDSLLDYGWASYVGPLHSNSSGYTALEFFTRQRDNLANGGIPGLITGANWWNGGDGSSGIVGPQTDLTDPGTGTFWVMAPSEIRSVMDAAILIPESNYFGYWNDPNGSGLGGSDDMLVLYQRADYIAAFEYAIDAGLARGSTAPPKNYFTDTGFFTAPAPPTLNVGSGIRDSLTSHKVFKLVDNARTQSGEYPALNVDNSIIYYIQNNVGTVADLTWNIPFSTVQVSNPRGAFGTGPFGNLDGVIWARANRVNLYFCTNTGNARIYRRNVVTGVSSQLKDVFLDPTFSSFWSARSITPTAGTGLHSDRDQARFALLISNASGVVGVFAWDQANSAVWNYQPAPGKVAVRVTLDDPGQYMKVVFSDRTFEVVELISNNFLQQLGVKNPADPPLRDDAQNGKVWQGSGRGLKSWVLEPTATDGTLVYAHPQRASKIDVNSIAVTSMQSLENVVYYTTYYGGGFSQLWALYAGAVYVLDWAAEMVVSTNKRVPDVVRQGTTQLTFIPFTP